MNINVLLKRTAMVVILVDLYFNFYSFYGSSLVMIRCYQFNSETQFALTDDLTQNEVGGWLPSCSTNVFTQQYAVAACSGECAYAQIRNSAGEITLKVK